MIRILAASALTFLLLLPMAALAAPAQYQLKVDGLACPFCAYGIEKKLTALDGVETAEVDLAAGAVIVTMEDGTALEEATARRAVKDAGFTLNGFTQISSGEGQ